MGTIKHTKVLYWSDSCREALPERIGRNSISEMTNVSMDTARLSAIKA